MKELSEGHSPRDHISPEEWYNEYINNLREISKSTKMDRQTSDALVVLWMGWVTRDIDEISNITGVNRYTTKRYAENAINNGIWRSDHTIAIGKWPGFAKKGTSRSKSSTIMLLDCMAVSGYADKAVDKDGNEIYREGCPFRLHDTVTSYPNPTRTWVVSTMATVNRTTYIKLASNYHNATDRKIIDKGKWRMPWQYTLVKTAEQLYSDFSKIPQHLP